MKYGHVFFDLDGTLIDSKKGIFNAVHYTLDTMEIRSEDRPHDLNPFIGPPLRDSFRNLFDFTDEDAEYATRIYRDYYSKQGLYEFTIFNGIRESLEYLHTKGMQLSVVTSKAEDYAKLIIVSTGFSSFFQTISGCELNGNRSSKLELINYTLKKLGQKPSNNILMVGDRYHDIRGAKQAGIASAAVLYGYGSKEELIEETPDIFIDTPFNLRNIIEN